MRSSTQQNRNARLRHNWSDGLQQWAPTVRACLSVFRIKTAEGFQYRIAGLAGASTGIFWVLIEITVYTVFYKYADNRDAGLMAGLSLKQLISYAWLTQVLFLMQPMNIDDEIRNKINSGDVGIEMCRPIDLYFHWFAKVAASRLTPLFWRGSITMLAGMLMPLSWRLAPPASLLGFLCALISVAGAFLLCSAFAMLASVTRLSITWGDGPTYIIMLVGGVLSGCYLPLQLWPEFLQDFLLLQPFAGYLDIPCRLYIGTMPPAEAVRAIGLQLLWTAVFIAAGKLMMAKKLKNIIVQGG
jgi:ABC-2 type transport system permease protein